MAVLVLVDIYGRAMVSEAHVSLLELMEGVYGGVTASTAGDKWDARDTGDWWGEVGSSTSMTVAIIVFCLVWQRCMRGVV